MITFTVTDKKYNDAELKNNLSIPVYQITPKLIENNNDSIMFSNDNTIYGLLDTLSINGIYNDILKEDIYQSTNLTIYRSPWASWSQSLPWDFKSG